MGIYWFFLIMNAPEFRDLKHLVASHLFLNIWKVYQGDLYYENALSCLHHEFSWEHFSRDKRQCRHWWRQTEQLCIILCYIMWATQPKDVTWGLVLSVIIISRADKIPQNNDWTRRAENCFKCSVITGVALPLTPHGVSLINIYMGNLIPSYRHLVFEVSALYIEQVCYKLSRREVSWCLWPHNLL